ncbi:MAG TPA: hypothetical protein VIQ27_19150, partial [Gemmatimonadales bacterium]
MAVSPIQRARAAGSMRAVFAHVLCAPPVLDIVVGLLIVVAVPLAIATVPNTISVVSDLLPPGMSEVGTMRAHGLALPAMLLTVPLAVLAHRRLHPAPILITGMAVLAATEIAGGYASSLLTVGILRVLQGFGAGLLVPATLVAAWQRPEGRRRTLLALWAGMLAASLLTAQALALWPLDQATTWRG